MSSLKIITVDESHRLKPMDHDYDQKLFYQLFKDTEGLRRKLSYEIDARRFGLENKDIMSCFNIKFIHAFNKYHKTKPDTIKGYIINSLQLYKNRLIKIAYQDKFKDKVSDLDITELYNYDDIDLVDDPAEVENSKTKEVLLSLVFDYLKTILSSDAYLVLDIEVNPPQYIIKEMKDLGKSINKTPIPDILIARYLDLGVKAPALAYVNSLRIEIKNALQMAKEHFKNNKDMAIVA